MSKETKLNVLKPKTLRIQPIAGKFLSATARGKIINVWLVDPHTNEQGTSVAYDDAIHLLTAKHPVVCLVQVKGEDGKYIRQISEEEENRIAEIREAAAAGYSLPEAEVSVEVPTDNKTLQALVSTQAALLQTQAVQIDELKAAVASLTEKFDAIASKQE